MRKTIRAAGIGLGLLLSATAVAGQTTDGGNWAPADPARVVSGSRPDRPGPPIIRAVRVAGDDIRVDGRATEAPWLAAPVASQFVQFEPREGAAATERTEARVLYGDDALYVAIRAFDSDPDGVVGQLTRRDQDSYSDQVGVVIDSYFDRRTAFQFAVNPVGVKYDVYRFDDTEEDSGWDAVWDVATTRDAQGWTAEFRIPYSQLRFKDADVQTWGINFLRVIARRDETDAWAPTTREDAAVVSKFGELQGLEGLKRPSHLEVVPYTVARVQRAPGDPANPLYDRTATSGTMGADIKYGVTSNLTLDVTLNPDFGQVEADPAEVNLTAVETFYPERRPFFLEGSSIFNFSIALGDGDGAGESLFYSRRIGRPPQGSVDADDAWVKQDPQTTILGAWKLSGKTAGGWSIGALHALTAEETARVAPETGAAGYRQAVEPFTSYGVVRVQRDFREGRSAVGVIATSVNRDRQVADQLGLRRGAYSGGVDFRHRFGDDRYQIGGYLLGSAIYGSEQAILDAQTSSLRYYQRPDMDPVRLDSTRTSLTGASAFLALQKIGGEHWRFSTGLHTRTPGFEVNDIGYQRDADAITNWVWVGYQQNTPQGLFRRWNLNVNAWTGWDYEGDQTGTGGNVNGSFQLRNFWSAYAGVNRGLGGLSSWTLRGGPLFRQEGNVNFWAGLSSDTRKSIRGSLNAWGNVRDESGSWNVGVSPSIRFRPSGRATFTLGSSLSRNVNDYQWVDELGTSSDPRYVFAHMDQTTVGLTARVDYAFTPDLSLQVYAQPFVSAGRYSDFKRVTDPRAARYVDRFEPLPAREDGGTVYASLYGNGSETSFGSPDFNFKQFRSNVVLRWEYRPGSTLYAVWAQGRNDYVENGAFHLGGDMNDLFGVRPDNVFMIKASYWLSR